MFDSRMSRAQVKNLDMPMGDPFGGPAYGKREDPVSSTIAAASSLVSGAMGYDAADKAADAQLAGTHAGIAAQDRMFQQNRADMAPWRDRGADALMQLSALLQPGGALMRDYTGDSLRSDPGYQFAMDEGRNAIDQSAAARGILFSGKTLKDIMRYGQDYGGTKFNEGFQRDLATKGFRQNALAGMSGTGMASAGQTAALGQSSANSIADLLGSGAAARASGIIGGANALSGGINNAANAYTQMSMLDRIMGMGSRGNYGGGYGSGAMANMDAYDLMSR